MTISLPLCLLRLLRQEMVNVTIDWAQDMSKFVVNFVTGHLRV